MKYNAPSQYETWKKTRKGFPPSERVERPVRGGGYERKQKFKKNWDQFSED